MLVKFCSRLSAESMISLTLFSAAATCAWMKRRVFPICAAKRSVGVGDDDWSFSAVFEVGEDFVGGVGVSS